MGDDVTGAVVEAFHMITHLDPVAFHIDEQGFLEIAELPDVGDGSDATELPELLRVHHPRADARLVLHDGVRCVRVHWRAHRDVHLILTLIALHLGVVYPRLAAFRLYTNLRKNPLALPAAQASRVLADLDSVERFCVQRMQDVLYRSGKFVMRRWHLVVVNNPHLLQLCFRPQSWRTVDGQMFAADARARLRETRLAESLGAHIQNGETDNMDDPVTTHWTAHLPPQVVDTCARHAIITHAEAGTFLHYTAPPQH